MMYRVSLTVGDHYINFDQLRFRMQGRVALIDLVT
jgi:hypothetical protein